MLADMDKIKFQGSPYDHNDHEGTDLSDLVRDIVGMDDLFDGNCEPDEIDRIVIDYKKITKIEHLKANAGSDLVTFDYSEKLIVDRKTESIEYIQNIGTGCVISQKYHVEEDISNLLDGLDADSLFRNIEGNPADVIDDPNETKDYTITVDFKKKPQLIIIGSFDKNGLPDDWPEFAEKIFDCISSYGYSEILSPSVYGKVKRRAGEFMFCCVKFTKGSKSYYYISDDDTIKVGDLVKVPAGKDEHTATAEVVDIEYFSEEKAPFPIEKVKHIIGRS
jgi:hypothetical protein